MLSPTHATGPLAIQVTANGTLQLACSFTTDADQVFQIITSGDAKLAHEFPCRGFKVSIVPTLGRQIILWATEIRVAGDRGRTLEALQTGFGLGLRGGVEGGAAEELVRRDAFLGSEFRARILFRVVCKVVNTSKACQRWVGRGGSPSCAGFGVPTDPKPIFLGAAAVVAPFVPPTCPKPNRPMPIPSRSISLGLRW